MLPGELPKAIAGFDWDETDKLRKAVSKKDPVLFAKITKTFKEKAISRGIDEKVVNVLEGKINIQQALLDALKL